MTTATRQIRFTPLRLDGSGAPSVASGYYLIEPTAAYDDGTGRVEELAFQVTIDGAAVTVDLPVTSTFWALKVAGILVDGNTTQRTLEYVAVPAGDATVVLNFEDLVRLDPATLDPAEAPEAAWWASLASTFAAAVLTEDPLHPGLYLVPIGSYLYPDPDHPGLGFYLIGAG